MQTAVAHNLTLSKAGSSAAVRKAGARRLPALRAGSSIRCQAVVRTMHSTHAKHASARPCSLCPGAAGGSALHPCLP
jgi:hypothetical protein